MNRITKAPGVLLIPALLSLSGCAILDCEDYRTYSNTLDTWVGSDIERYERQLNRRPVDVMERPRNRLEYEYDTDYTQYDGSRLYCRTYFEVDRDTGQIVTWRYEGDCYMYGYCRS